MAEETIQKCKQLPQGSTDWFNRRRFRITASKATKVLQKSTNVMKLVDPDGNYFGMCKQDSYEIAIRLLFCTKIFETGLWIDDKANWLCASPDGICYDDSNKIPVEIKVIEACKCSHEIIVEYFVQLQLEMHLLRSNKCLFLIYRTNEKILEGFYVNYDRTYTNKLLKKLENAFYEKIVKVIGLEEHKVDYSFYFEKLSFEKNYLSFLKRWPKDKTSIFEKIVKTPYYREMDPRDLLLDKSLKLPFDKAKEISKEQHKHLLDQRNRDIIRNPFEKIDAFKMNFVKKYYEEVADSLVKL